MEKRLTVAQKIKLKKSLEQFITHPSGPCKVEYLDDCTLCIIMKECGSWAKKQVKGYKDLGLYRKDRAIQEYLDQYGKEELFELLL